ncbi:MAG: hypothetical protein M1820_010281 [Bogoriella megaspora]|nr:MAG: hypothetical protein M1820_010281 [Bogoriella megaspora]
MDATASVAPVAQVAQGVVIDDEKVHPVGEPTKVEQAEESIHNAQPELSLFKCILIIATLSGITTASSMTTGLLAVALPRMASDLHLSDGLLLWPASVYGLTSGCSLLIAGSIADIVGSRIVYLIGCLALSLFVLGSGLSQTSTQLIVFRGGQGIAVSMCLPTAMSLLTLYLPLGRRRNAGFAFVGAGQPLGYSIGLFLGGFFVDSIGWRYGWYMSAAVALAVLIVGVFGLPMHAADGVRSSRVKKIVTEVDWVGAIVASAGLGMLSYVLAVVANRSSSIKEATQIALLCVAAICLPFFIFWMKRQQRLGKPALIPNYVWKKLAFSSICIMVFLTWAVVQTLEYFFSLYFQKVQKLSATQTSIRFIPNVVIGIVLSVAIGMVLHRASAYWIILLVCCLTAISPLLMALVEPTWSYWYATFWAVLLSPLSGDVLFVISGLIITNTFPEGTQALASAVFNTISQFGTAAGLAIMAVISSSVSQDYAQRRNIPVETSANDYGPDILLEGYRASYWACFGFSLLTCGIGALGLKGVANKGMKKD